MKESIYRTDIDGLRAIAVIAVIVFHAVPESLSGGFVGLLNILCQRKSTPPISSQIECAIKPTFKEDGQLR